MMTTIFRWKTSMFDNKSSIKNRKFVLSFVRDSNSYLKLPTFQRSSVRVIYAALQQQKLLQPVAKSHPFNKISESVYAFSVYGYLMMKIYYGYKVVVVWSAHL